MGSHADFFQILGSELQLQQNAPLVYPQWEAMQFRCRVWIRVMVIFFWLFLFSHQQTPLLKMQSSGFIPKLFDLNHLPVRFWHSASGEAHLWLIFRFICLVSHLPGCMPWFLLLYICVACILLSSLWDCYPVTHQGWISEWLWRCGEKSPTLVFLVKCQNIPS